MCYFQNVWTILSTQAFVKGKQQSTCVGNMQILWTFIVLSHVNAAVEVSVFKLRHSILNCCFERNRYLFAVRLFYDGSQMTSKCSENQNEAYEMQPGVSLMF